LVWIYQTSDKTADGNFSNDFIPAEMPFSYVVSQSLGKLVGLAAGLD
jgi:hypothetical protein